MLLPASEGAGENLFIVRKGVVYTPDSSAGALNGITRNTIFSICKDLGIEIKEKPITRDEIYIADEAFFSGTAAEVTPIRELDRIEIGSGSRGSRSFFLVVAILQINIIIVTGVIRPDKSILAVVERGSWEPLQFLASGLFLAKA